MLGWAGTNAGIKMISCILRRDFLLTSASPAFSSRAPSAFRQCLQHICEELTFCKVPSHQILDFYVFWSFQPSPSPVGILLLAETSQLKG